MEQQKSRVIELKNKKLKVKKPVQDNSFSDDSDTSDDDPGQQPNQISKLFNAGFGANSKSKGLNVKKQPPQKRRHTILGDLFGGFQRNKVNVLSAESGLKDKEMNDQNYQTDQKQDVKDKIPVPF